jgi:hypothetical protein
MESTLRYGDKKMNDLSTWHSALQSKLRSLGVKLFVVCGLALLMLIPALLVGGLVEERTTRETQVVNEISAHVGGQQTFLGPTLAIPFRIPPQPGKDYEGRGTYLVFPTRASAVLKTATEERRRSLFKVPVFQVEAKFEGEFDLTGVPNANPSGAQHEEPWPTERSPSMARPSHWFPPKPHRTCPLTRSPDPRSGSYFSGRSSKALPSQMRTSP